MKHKPGDLIKLKYEPNLGLYCIVKIEKRTKKYTLFPADDYGNYERYLYDSNIENFKTILNE